MPDFDDLLAPPGVPSAPAVPGMPSVPGVPSIPNVPDVPDVPDVPEIPGVPGIPELPSVPDVPSLPDIPQVPGVPAVPGMPSVPGLPSVPGVPGVPGMPGAPAVPAVPLPGAAAVPAVGAPPAPPAVAPSAPAVRAARPAAPPAGGGASGGGGASRQTERALRVHTALGDDAFILTRVEGEEAVSRPFRFTLDLEADPGGAVDAAVLLGTPASVEIAAAPGEFRVLHGRVSRFRRVGGGTVLDRYQLELVPWLWMLSLSTDCRIFQRLSVPDIVAQVFRDLGFTDFRMRLVRTYPEREYCVQYRESHLDFVSRLLEEEGIFYAFAHEAERHVLVLGDEPPSVGPCPGLPALRPAPGPGAWVEELHTLYSDFAVERAMHPVTVTLADYNYLTPSVSLEASLSTDEGAGELFDYPGKYEAADDGTRYVRLRLEGAESERERAEGMSQAPGLVSGTTVKVEGAAGDRDWLVLAVGHRATQGSAVAGAPGAFSYANTFTAVPAGTPWRPPRLTPRPRVRGTQSALVVGVAGEEIYTDAQGRVKLHFYWDRRGRRDENSSCWVRCSTAWAGKGWGQFSVPRVGQEVLVDFLEGDPDRPVVVGRVYNADQPPPCDPGASGGAVSGMRSKSHRGDGYNGIEMTDTAGAEKFDVHAQFDMSTTVGNNDTQHVTVDRTITVDGKHTETVKGDTSVTVTSGAYSLDVAAGTATVHVTGAVSESFDATQETTVTSDIAITSTSAKIGISAATEILLCVGASSLLMKSDGTITLTGVNITVDGSTKVDVMSDSAVTAAVGGQTLKLSTGSADIAGAKVSSAATGVNEISGATVKLN